MSHQHLEHLIRQNETLMLDLSPSPKNPVIARMFKEIEHAEELGSGVRNLFRYAKLFAGHDPLLQEEQLFRVTVAIPSFAAIEGVTTPHVTPQVKRAELVLEYCRKPRTRGEIQLFAGMKHCELF